MIRAYSNKQVYSKSQSRLSHSFHIARNKTIPELEENIIKAQSDKKKKAEDLMTKVIILEEKLKCESRWRETYLSEISEADKKIQQSKAYARALEGRLKNAKKKVEFFRSKYLEAEEKLGYAKEYLKKAKILIENSEIANETTRSVKFAILQTMKSLFSDEKPNALRLNHVELTDEFTIPIKKILKLYPTIENLQLEGNLLTDTGIQNLSEALTYLPLPLKIINLNFNLITPSGAWYLIKCLSDRNLKLKIPPLSKVQEIHLSYNKFESSNDLFVKAWEYLDSTTSNIKSIFDKKYIMQADPKILTKTFERLAESYESIEIKEVLLTMLKVKLEYTKPLNDNEEDLLLPGNTNRVFETFQQLFPDQVKDEQRATGNFLNEKSENFVVKGKKVRIEEVFVPGNNNYAKIVDGLMENGFDLNMIDENLKETLLMYACRTGNLALVQVLCKRKVELELKNVKFIKEFGDNAFLIACKEGKLHCAEYLLSKGANPYSCDSKKRTVMHLAAIEDNEAKVKKFIKFGISVNCFDGKQRLPLHYSCKNGNLNLCALFLDCGSEPNAKDKNGLSPLALGLSKGFSNLDTVFL